MKNYILRTCFGGRSLRNIVLMFLALLSVAQAQVVVKVPKFCTVVVPGTGGNAASGIVGHGGVVVMPDPFDYPNLNFVATLNSPLPPNDYYLTGWSVLGDLSFQTSGSIITSFGANLVANIESFNKNARTSETTSPSLGTLARSKGRVYVNCAYTSLLCQGASISFDVYKTYSSSTYLPPIIGPSCWTPNSTVTYSVDAIASDNLGDAIGTDTYFWEIKDAANNTLNSFYGSADNSSITFTTPANASGQWTISCGYGLANPWVGSPNFANRTTVVTKAINAPGPAPTFATSPPSCLNTGTTSFAATLVPQIGMSYAWSYTGSGSPTVTQSGASNETATISGMDDNPGILTLTVTNTLGFCPAVQTFQYPINRNFVAPMAITLPSNASCIAPGSTFQLSLPANAMNNPTTWALPSGWSYTANNAMASTITVSVPNSATGGPEIITANSTSCASGTIMATVSVAPTVVISGPSCVTYGSTSALTYTAVSVGGPSTYTWTLPPGWGTFGPPNPNLNTITVFPSGNTVGNVTVTVCIGSCCTTTSMAVNFNPVTPVINGPPCFDVGMDGNAVFSISNPLPGTYTWTVDAGFGSFVGPNTGTVVHIATLASALGVYPTAVTVTHTTPCGTSTASAYVAKLLLNGTLNLQANPGMDILSLTGFNSPGNFMWVQDCGMISESVCGSCGTGPITILTNALTGGSWGVIVPDFLGCFSKQCTTTTYGNRMAQNTNSGAEASDALATEVTLSPNPNGGEFDIRVDKVKTSADFVVFDAMGQQVASGKLKAGTNRFNQSKLASGIYYVHISVDGKTTLKRVEILH